MSEPTSAHGARLLLVAAACALVLAGVWLALGSRPLALAGDNESLTHPLLADAFRRLSAGTLPIRTAGRWGGSALAGDPVAGALYPPYYLGFWLTTAPHERALDVAVVLHLVVLVAGMAWWLRGLGVPDGPALAAALIAATTPTLAFAARGWIQYWAAVAWWPWLWGAAARLARQPTVRHALLAAAALALPVYAGYPQFALYGGAVGLGWIVLAPGPARGRRLGIALAVGAGAVGLAGPPIAAALATASVSIRSGPEGAAALAALDVFRLPITSWVDVVRTAPLSVTAPCRVAPLLVPLALVGAFDRRRFAAVFLGLAALAALVLAAGGVPFRTLHALPPFSAFAGPVKLFYLAALLAAGLAGLGLARLCVMPPSIRRAALVAAAALTATASPAVGLVVLATAALPARALGAALLGAGVASAAASLVATAALTAPHLVTAGPFTPLLREPPERFGVDGAAGRWVALDAGPRLRQVGMNFGVRWDVPSWSGVGPLVPWRQHAALENADSDALLPVIDQLGVAGVVVRAGSPLAQTLAGAGFVPAAPHAGLQAFRRGGAAAPRFVLAGTARVVPAPDAIAAARAGRGLDAGRAVTIESPAPPDGADGDAAGSLGVVDDAPDAAALRARVARPTWLVARDPFHPSWEATIDGAPAAIVPAAGFLQAVLVPAGDHQIVLRYREHGLARGALLLAATLLGLPLVLRALVRPAAQNSV